MAHFKMKFGGSAVGASKKRYRFNRYQIIEADKGEFTEEDAEDVSKDFEEPIKRRRKKKVVSGEAVETAAIEPNTYKRG